MSEQAEQLFDRFSVVPPEPGTNVHLDHCSPDIRTSLLNLIKTYDKAFAASKYDCGYFRGFLATLETIPGSSVIEKERPMSQVVIEELRPIITELLEHGILKLAEKQGPFLSNCHGVSKPQAGLMLQGKADAYLLKKSGQSTNHARLTIDLRNLNKFAVTKPKTNLPNHDTLKNSFKDTYVSKFDLCSHFWSVGVDYETQSNSNFFFAGKVYSFTRLPMGFVNSSFIGQRASEMAYGDDSMHMFLKHKNWTINSHEWPFKSTTEFLVLYLDDLAVYSSRSLPNAVTVHLHVNEFCLWATQYWGFRLGRANTGLS